MNREAIDTLWHKAMNESIKAGEDFTRYHFAALVAEMEREECAKLAAQTVCDTHLPTGVKVYGSRAAKAIRARGDT